MTTPSQPKPDENGWFHKKIEMLSLMTKKEKLEQSRLFASECRFGNSAYLVKHKNGILSIIQDNFYD